MICTNTVDSTRTTLPSMHKNAKHKVSWVVIPAKWNSDYSDIHAIVREPWGISGLDFHFAIGLIDGKINPHKMKDCLMWAVAVDTVHDIKKRDSEFEVNTETAIETIRRTLLSAIREDFPNAI